MYRALLEGDDNNDSSKKSGKNLQESRKVEQALRSHGVKVNNAAAAATNTNISSGNAVVTPRGGPLFSSSHRAPPTSRKESGVSATQQEGAYSARGYSRTSSASTDVALSASSLAFPSSVAAKSSEAPNLPIPFLSSSLPATPRSTTTITCVIDAAAAAGTVPAPAPQPVLYSWLPALASSTRLSSSGVGGGGGSSAPSSGVKGGGRLSLLGGAGTGIGMRAPIRYVRPQSLTSNPNVPPQTQNETEKDSMKEVSKVANNNEAEEEKEDLQRRRSSCRTVAPSSSAIMNPATAATTSGNNRVPNRGSRSSTTTTVIVTATAGALDLMGVSRIGNAESESIRLLGGEDTSICGDTNTNPNMYRVDGEGFTREESWGNGAVDGLPTTNEEAQQREERHKRRSTVNTTSSSEMQYRYLMLQLDDGDASTTATNKKRGNEGGGGGGDPLFFGRNRGGGDHTRSADEGYDRLNSGFSAVTSPHFQQPHVGVGGGGSGGLWPLVRSHIGKGGGGVGLAGRPSFFGGVSSSNALSSSILRGASFSSSPPKSAEKNRLFPPLRSLSPSITAIAGGGGVGRTNTTALVISSSSPTRSTATPQLYNNSNSNNNVPCMPSPPPLTLLDSHSSPSTTTGASASSPTRGVLKSTTNNKTQGVLPSKHVAYDTAVKNTRHDDDTNSTTTAVGNNNNNNKDNNTSTNNINNNGGRRNTSVSADLTAVREALRQKIQSVRLRTPQEFEAFIAYYCDPIESLLSSSSAAVVSAGSPTGSPKSSAGSARRHGTEDSKALTLYNSKTEEHAVTQGTLTTTMTKQSKNSSQDLPATTTTSMDPSPQNALLNAESLEKLDLLAASYTKVVDDLATTFPSLATVLAKVKRFYRDLVVLSRAAQEEALHHVLSSDERVDREITRYCQPKLVTLMHDRRQMLVHIAALEAEVKALKKTRDEELTKAKVEVKETIAKVTKEDELASAQRTFTSRAFQTNIQLMSRVYELCNFIRSSGQKVPGEEAFYATANTNSENNTISTSLLMNDTLHQDILFGKPDAFVPSLLGSSAESSEKRKGSLFAAVAAGSRSSVSQGVGRGRTVSVGGSGDGGDGIDPLLSENPLNDENTNNGAQQAKKNKKLRQSTSKLLGTSAAAGSAFLTQKGDLDNPYKNDNNNLDEDIVGGNTISTSEHDRLMMQRMLLSAAKEANSTSKWIVAHHKAELEKVRSENSALHDRIADLQRHLVDLNSSIYKQQRQQQSQLARQAKWLAANANAIESFERFLMIKKNQQQQQVSAGDEWLELLQQGNGNEFFDRGDEEQSVDHKSTALMSPSAVVSHLAEARNVLLGDVLLTLASPSPSPSSALNSSSPPAGFTLLAKASAALAEANQKGKSEESRSPKTTNQGLGQSTAVGGASAEQQREVTAKLSKGFTEALAAEEERRRLRNATSTSSSSVAAERNNKSSNNRVPNSSTSSVPAGDYLESPLTSATNEELMQEEENERSLVKNQKERDAPGRRRRHHSNNKNQTRSKKSWNREINEEEESSGSVVMGSAAASPSEKTSNAPATVGKALLRSSIESLSPLALATTGVRRHRSTTDSASPAAAATAATVPPGTATPAAVASSSNRSLTPRPIFSFQVQSQLGVLLKNRPTHEIVAELSTVALNLKSELEDVSLSRRKLLAGQNYIDSLAFPPSTIVGGGTIDGGVDPPFIETIPETEWPSIPHFLRTRVTPHVINTFWTSPFTASIVKKFFVGYVRYRLLAAERRDFRMLAPRIVPISDRRKHVHVRLDVTAEEAARAALLFSSKGGGVDSTNNNTTISSAREKSSSTGPALQKGGGARGNGNNTNPSISSESRSSIAAGGVTYSTVRSGRNGSGSNNTDEDGIHQVVVVNSSGSGSSLFLDSDVIPFGYVVTTFFLHEMQESVFKHKLIPSGNRAQLLNKNGEDTVVELELTKLCYNFWYSVRKYRHAEPVCDLFVQICEGQIPREVFFDAMAAVSVLRWRISSQDSLARAGSATAALSYPQISAGVLSVMTEQPSNNWRSILYAANQTFKDNNISVHEKIPLSQLFAGEAAKDRGAVGGELVGSSFFVKAIQRVVVNKYNDFFATIEALLLPYVRESTLVPGLCLIRIPDAMRVLSKYDEEYNNKESGEELQYCLSIEAQHRQRNAAARSGDSFRELHEKSSAEQKIRDKRILKAIRRREVRRKRKEEKTLLKNGIEEEKKRRKSSAVVVASSDAEREEEEKEKDLLDGSSRSSSSSSSCSSYSSSVASSSSSDSYSRSFAPDGTKKISSPTTAMDRLIAGRGETTRKLEDLAYRKKLAEEKGPAPLHALSKYLQPVEGKGGEGMPVVLTLPHQRQRAGAATTDPQSAGIYTSFGGANAYVPVNMFFLCSFAKVFAEVAASLPKMNYSTHFPSSPEVVAVASAEAEEKRKRNSGGGGAATTSEAMAVGEGDTNGRRNTLLVVGDNKASGTAAGQIQTGHSNNINNTISVGAAATPFPPNKSLNPTTGAGGIDLGIGAGGGRRATLAPTSSPSSLLLAPLGLSAGAMEASGGVGGSLSSPPTAAVPPSAPAPNTESASDSAATAIGNTTRAGRVVVAKPPTSPSSPQRGPRHQLSIAAFALSHHDHEVIEWYHFISTLRTYGGPRRGERFPPPVASAALSSRSLPPSSLSQHQKLQQQQQGGGGAHVDGGSSVQQRVPYMRDLIFRPVDELEQLAATTAQL